MRPQPQEDFKQNERLEQLLQELGTLLGPVEKEVMTRYRMPRWPVVFVAAAARGGSTLMTQWLAQTGCFAYPTNLLSRFYDAPYVGAKIQQLLTDPAYNYRNEIVDFHSRISFKSEAGKTQGALEPNEFWRFWRRFVPQYWMEYIDEEALAGVDGKGFAAELAALEDVFQKPFVLKAHIMETNLPFLSSLLDNALFIFVHRQPFYNVQSLLELSERYFGDRGTWFGVRPKEYVFLKDLDPFEQAAGQVHYVNKAIAEGLAQIDPARALTVAYEEFCRDPHRVFDQIRDKFAAQHCEQNWEYHGPERFEPTNQVRVSPEDAQRIIAAYRKIADVSITP